MMKKLCSLLLALVMVVTLLPGSLWQPAMAEDISGQFGDNLTWTLDDAGTLTIAGEGPIPDFEFDGAPWYSKRSAITRVIIQTGITRIGGNSFSESENLKEVFIPEGVDIIGSGAFFNCGSLAEITIPSSVSAIWNAFQNCASLQAIHVDENNTWYSSEDGVLFNKDKTELVWYPSGRPGSVYSVPESVHTLQRFAFRLPSYLEQINVGETVTKVNDFAFNICTCAILFEGSAPSFTANAFGYSYAKVYYPSDNATWDDVAGKTYGATGLEWKDLSLLPVVAHARHEWKSYSVYLGASLSPDLDCTCGGDACSLQVTEDGFRMAFGSPYDAVLYLFKPADSTGLQFADPSVNNYAKLEDLGDGVYKLSLAASGDWWGRQKDGRAVYDTDFHVPIRIMYGYDFRCIDVAFSATAAHSYRGIAVSASKTEDVRCTDGCGIGEVTFDTNGENLVDTGFVATYTDLQEAYVYLTTDGKKLSLYKGYEQFARLEHVSGYTYKLTLVQPREYGVYQDDRWGDGTYIAIARTGEDENWDPFRVWFTPAQHTHTWGKDHRCTVCRITDPAANLKDLVAQNPGAVQAESGSEKELADAIENGTVHAEVETVPSQGEAENFNLAEGETFLRCWNTMFHLFDGNGIRKLGQLLELEHAYMVEYEIEESEYEWLSHHWNITIVRRHYDAGGVCSVERLGMPQIGCMETGAGKRYFVQFASDRFSDFALVVGKEMTGDINCDEDIDITDLQALFTYLSTGKAENAKLQAQPDTLLRAADVTGDDVVNILDYQALYETVQAG